MSITVKITNQNELNSIKKFFNVRWKLSKYVNIPGTDEINYDIFCRIFDDGDIMFYKYDFTGHGDDYISFDEYMLLKAVE